jgi:hypothetical protein
MHRKGGAVRQEPLIDDKMPAAPRTPGSGEEVGDAAAIMVRLSRRESLAAPLSAVGLILGLLIMYATGLFVPA